jgi:hypothetical protein
MCADVHLATRWREGWLLAFLTATFITQNMENLFKENKEVNRKT